MGQFGEVSATLSFWQYQIRISDVPRATCRTSSRRLSVWRVADVAPRVPYGSGNASESASEPVLRKTLLNDDCVLHITRYMKQMYKM